MLTLLISDPMMDEKMDEIKSLNVPIVKKFIYNIPVLSKEILNDYNQRIQKTDYLTYQVRKNVNSCLYGQIFIAANQEIYPCPYLRDFKLGDLHNDTISSILHKGEYRKFWYMAKSKIKPCNDCKHNVQCFDCRAIEYSVEKKIDSEYYCSQRELF
ncbi:SPASM domain-containing protein [Cellulosilyticum ruminicola]|uniref:SPASM domain-containing protein n=1 Tax=Cellulosilyticum ruminicola TaxID=425254 RepID=UPI0006D061D9|nr:SPASM domain-containing protein [Cellulosilyticum ruminicola]